MIELREVSFIRDDKYLLKDIDYVFERGKCYLITGLESSGKSLLTKVLGGIIKPDEGKVLANGRDLYSRTDKCELKNKIGFVFQDGVFISNLSIRENLQLPVKHLSPGTNYGELMNSIRLLFNEFQIDIGLLDKRPSELAYSVKKVISFVRAVLIDPEIYILNKPLFNLDFIDMKRIISYLARMKCSEKILIITGNNRSLIENLADEIILLANGEIVAKESAESFFSSTNPEIKTYIKNNLG